MASQIIGFIPKLTQIDFSNVSISLLDGLSTNAQNCLWADTSVKTVANFHVLSSRRKGKKKISGEWSPKINGNWISPDRTEKWMERTVRGPGISSWQSLPVIEFTSTPVLASCDFLPPSNETAKVWLLKIMKHTHNWCKSLEYSGRKAVRMKDLWVKSFF